MKKLLFISLAILLPIIFLCPLKVTFAAQGKQYYAKVQSDDVFFYDQPLEEDQHQLFVLPTTYFVVVYADANDEFYACRYDNLTGYVKKESVSVMEGTPQKPFATFATFRLFAVDGLDIKSTPYNLSSNTLARVPFLQDDLIYYGNKIGDDLVPDKTNIWYYCKYTTGLESFQGYIYSAFCDQLAQIPLNNEKFAIVSTPIFSSQDAVTLPATQLSGTAKTLIIIGVTLPSILILYLIIKPTLITEHKTAKRKQTKVKKKHGDYFEFDENDLN